MKKVLVSLVALVLLMMPMTSFAADTEPAVSYSLENTEENYFARVQ